MTRPTPIAEFLTEPGHGDHRGTVYGIEVAYSVEPEDRDTNLPAVHLLTCVKIGGSWINYDAFAEDFWLTLQNALWDAASGATDERSPYAFQEHDE